MACSSRHRPGLREATDAVENAAGLADMTIRLAGSDDIQAVWAIMEKAIRRMDQQGIPQWDDIYPSQTTLIDDIKRQQMYVISGCGRTVGIVVINDEEPPEYGDVDWSFGGEVMVVHRLTIDPDFQRAGLASRLMNFAERQATERGYRCIRLDAFTENPAALALYEKRGYRKAGAVAFRKGKFFCYEKEIGT
jgi:ribosomal protein S18 acetylase RimI-like enzyme